jgi:hypothetical protein
MVPSPMLSAIIGDCIHCVRCALDHVVAGHAPEAMRERSSFPIRMKDPWKKRPNGRFAYDTKSRSSFNRAVSGLPEGAVAAIKALQPYEKTLDPALDPLTVISILDNADKHRQIVTMLFGIEAISTQVFVRDQDATDERRANKSILETGDTIQEGGLVHTGTPVARFRLLDSTITEADVEVKVSGTVKVAVRVEGHARNLLLPDALRTAIDYTGDALLRILKAIQDECRHSAVTDAPHAGRTDVWCGNDIVALTRAEWAGPHLPLPRHGAALLSCQLSGGPLGNPD